MANTAAVEQSRAKTSSSSKFKQQRLKAWQPILTAGSVLPTFFVIGIVCLPVGIALYIFSSEDVVEHRFSYTYCDAKENTQKKCAEIIQENIATACTCEIPFELKENMEKNVYLYYGLSNFYQNHRRYVKSRDDNQLLGYLDQEPSPDCEPFAYDEDKKPIAPCGAIANSMFNDTITLAYTTEGQTNQVKLLKTGIAWESDKTKKFQNPQGENLQAAFEGTVKPPYWTKAVYELDPDDKNNNGFQNEDLIVWMRTAALPNFRKLYRRIDHEETYFKSGLPKGNYTFKIQYKYPVISFDGEKHIILSNTSLLGGKNPFLGIAYMVVGCICLLMGMLLLIIHGKYGKNMKDMINVDNRTPYN